MTGGGEGDEDFDLLAGRSGVEGVLDRFPHQGVRKAPQDLGGEKFPLDGVHVDLSPGHSPESPGWMGHLYFPRGIPLRPGPWIRAGGDANLRRRIRQRAEKLPSCSPCEERERRGNLIMGNFIMNRIASPAESGVAMTIQRVFLHPAGLPRAGQSWAPSAGKPGGPLIPPAPEVSPPSAAGTRGKKRSSNTPAPERPGKGTSPR